MRGLKLGVSFVMCLGCLALLSCGGNSVRPLATVAQSNEPDPQTDPLVSIKFDGYNPETTNLRFNEGETVIFEIDTLNTTATRGSLVQTSGPTVDFGEFESGGVTSEGDLSQGEGTDRFSFSLRDAEGARQAQFTKGRRLTAKFVVPSVATRRSINFQFQSSSPTQSRSRVIPIIIEDNASAITLTGKASKGLISNTKVKLFSVDGFIEDQLNINRQIVEPTRIDETGNYTFVILPATDFEKLLLYKIEADGADMVCDAPQGCNNVDFGDVFEVEKDLDLRAYIQSPSLGTFLTVNINIMTTLTARSAQELAEPFERVDPEDVGRAQAETARIFGLVNQDFTRLPFVDVTSPITSGDENAIRAAILGGGVLGAAFEASDPKDDDEYLGVLKDFIKEFSKGVAPCRDSAADSTISIEDVFKSAQTLARIHGSDTTQTFFNTRASGLQNGTISCDFLSRIQE